MDEMEGITLFGGILEHLEVNLAPFLENRSPSTEGEQDRSEKAFDLFMQQYKYLSSCSFFENQENLVFTALEQTNLFYDYSMLFRIKSCSVLDYIKSDPGRLKILNVYKAEDEKLLSEYNQEKKKFRNDNEVLRSKEREIDTNLLKFFKEINSDRFKEAVDGKNEKDHNCKVRFLFKIKEK
jgi:hypothetical protein